MCNCEKCNATFSRYDNLTKHLKNKHDLFLFYCNECLANGFNRKISLIQHLSKY